MEKKVALVTGGNRGLGLETCRELAKQGYEVILTARDEKKGKEKAKELNVVFHHLDMDDPKSIEETIHWIEKTYGRLDVLINNAGILLDWGTDKTNKETLEKTFTTNVVGPYLLLEKASAIMKKNHFGRVVNVSSTAGQMEGMDLFYPAYRISKAALNAVTSIFASALKAHGILVNSVCPGWCKTDMGGPNATLPVEKGVASILFAVDLPADGPTGKFFQHGQEIPW